MNFHYIAHVKRSMVSEDSFPYWIFARDLSLNDNVAEEWNSFIMMLNKVGIRLNVEEDVLVWDWKGTNGIPSTKKSYESISNDQGMSSPNGGQS